MEGFTIIDGVVAIVIILSAILAYARGFVRETLAIVGWVAAAGAAYIFAPQVEPLVKEVPIINQLVAKSCELSLLAAFTGVFVAALIVASIFTPLFANMVQRSALGGVDQALGFLFGVLRGAVLVAIAFFIYDRVITSAPIPMVDDSRSKQLFASVIDQIEQRDPEQAMGWVTRQYEELVGYCSARRPAPAGNTPEAGAETGTMQQPPSQ